MRFSKSNQLVLLMMIFNIQYMRISVLCSGKIYCLLKLRCFCGYCCRVRSLSTRRFLASRRIVNYDIAFVVWKLRSFTAFLFIAMWLGGSGIVLYLGMMGVCQTLFIFFCRNGIICYMGSFSAKPSIVLCLWSIWIACNKDAANPDRDKVYDLEFHWIA